MKRPAEAPRSIVSAPSDLGQAAVAYAKRGWFVFPLFEVDTAGSCVCSNRKCTSPGKHPRVLTGLKSATTDPMQISRWWSQWPQANIGIATGAISGFAVLDIDGPEGEASLALLEAEHADLPATTSAKTGKGRHLLFEHPADGLKTTTSIGRKASRLDSRGDGGYIVAAPSRHHSGRTYEWIDLSAPLAAMPQWLCDVIRGPRSNVVPFIKTRKNITAESSAATTSIPEGERNNTLLSRAGMMRRADMSRDAIEKALLAENKQRCTPPLEDDEVLGIVDSIFKYAANASAETIVRSLNDTGNAERFIATHREDLRYVLGESRWLHWNNERWERDGKGHICELAKGVAKAIYAEAAACCDEAVAKQLQGHAKASLQLPKLKAMAELARTDPAVVIRQEQLDADPWLFGVANGILDLETRKLRIADKDSLVLRYSSVVFDRQATCPAFVEFLDTIFDGNKPLIGYVQRVVGYCLTGCTTEQCLFFLYGTGGNGKSTLTGLLADLLGDYALQAPSEMLIQKSNGRSQTNDLARLRGARAVISSEVEDGSAFSETLVKELTGGDMITARFLYAEYFEFRPQFKLLLLGNHKPHIRGSDEGIWRRIQLIPFAVTIPPKQRDKQLVQKLRAELPGILNWALLGLAAWTRGGLNAPDTVTDAVKEYREDMDLLGKWIGDRCELGEAFEAKADALYGSYAVWSTLNGHHRPSMSTFGRKLTERFGKRRAADGYHYLGLHLNPMIRGNGGLY